MTALNQDLKSSLMQKLISDLNRWVVEIGELERRVINLERQNQKAQKTQHSHPIPDFVCKIEEMAKKRQSIFIQDIKIEDLREAIK